MVGGTPPMAHESPDGRSEEVTRLLRDWRAGDREAFDRLVPMVYGELKRIAVNSLRGERVGHTLQPTALVHELYGRLLGAKVDWADRVHFFAVAARTARRVLVDYARSRASAKRGGGALRVTLDERVAGSAEADVVLLALDDALSELEAVDERKGRLIELHYFGGMTYAEAGEVVGVSEATVKRELRMAKAWLRTEMTAA